MRKGIQHGLGDILGDKISVAFVSSEASANVHIAGTRPNLSQAAIAHDLPQVCQSDAGAVRSARWEQGHTWGMTARWFRHHRASGKAGSACPQSTEVC